MFGIQTEIINGVPQVVIRVKGDRVVTIPHPADGPVSIASLPSPVGRAYFVKPTGASTNSGLGWDSAFALPSQAVSAASAGDNIHIAPGDYDDIVTIPRAKSNLSIFGYGALGSVFIAPTTTNATALTNEADDVTIVNVGLDGDGTGSGLVNRGRRFRIYRSKIEGGAVGAKMTLGTAAQVAAETHGDGSDSQIVECEITWNTKGVELVATDHGAVTQLRILNTRFHDNTAADVEESGGSASIRFRELEVGYCSFLRQEDGTEPTAYILLSDDNTNSGVVHNSSFPTALDGGKNLVSTGLIWAGNLHTGGISTGQPS